MTSTQSGNADAFAIQPSGIYADAVGEQSRVRIQCRCSAAGILRARFSLVKGLRSLRDGLRPPLTSEPLRALSGAPRAGHGLPLVRLRLLFVS